MSHLLCLCLRHDELKESGDQQENHLSPALQPVMARLRKLDDAGLARDRKQQVLTLTACLSTLSQPHVLFVHRVMANIPALIENSSGALERMWEKFAQTSFASSRILAWCLQLTANIQADVTPVEREALDHFQTAVMKLCLFPLQTNMLLPSFSSTGYEVTLSQPEARLVHSGVLDDLMTAGTDLLHILRFSRLQALTRLEKFQEAISLVVTQIVSPAFGYLAKQAASNVAALPKISPRIREDALKPDGTINLSTIPLRELLDLRYFVTALSRSSCASSMTPALQHELAGPSLLASHSVNDTATLSQYFSLLATSMSASASAGLPIVSFQGWYNVLNPYLSSLVSAFANDGATVTGIGFPQSARLDLAVLVNPLKSPSFTFVDSWWLSLCQQILLRTKSLQANAKLRLDRFLYELRHSVDVASVWLKKWNEDMSKLMDFREAGHRRRQEGFVSQLSTALGYWLGQKSESQMRYEADLQRATKSRNDFRTEYCTIEGKVLQAQRLLNESPQLRDSFDVKPITLLNRLSDVGNRVNRSSKSPFLPELTRLQAEPAFVVSFGKITIQLTAEAPDSTDGDADTTFAGVVAGAGAGVAGVLVSGVTAVVSTAKSYASVVAPTWVTQTLSTAVVAPVRKPGFFSSIKDSKRTGPDCDRLERTPEMNSVEVEYSTQHVRIVLGKQVKVRVDKRRTVCTIEFPVSLLLEVPAGERWNVQVVPNVACLGGRPILFELFIDPSHSSGTAKFVSISKACELSVNLRPSTLRLIPVGDALSTRSATPSSPAGSTKADKAHIEGLLRQCRVSIDNLETKAYSSSFQLPVNNFSATHPPPPDPTSVEPADIAARNIRRQDEVAAEKWGPHYFSLQVAAFINKLRCHEGVLGLASEPKTDTAESAMKVLASLARDAQVLCAPAYYETQVLTAPSFDSPTMLYGSRAVVDIPETFFNPYNIPHHRTHRMHHDIIMLMQSVSDALGEGRRPAELSVLNSASAADSGVATPLVQAVVQIGALRAELVTLQAIEGAMQECIDSDGTAESGAKALESLERISSKLRRWVESFAPDQLPLRQNRALFAKSEASLASVLAFLQVQHSSF
jgi:hypothetical protein